MVSGIFTIIVVVLIGSTLGYYLITTFNEPEMEKPVPSFVDFSLRQEGSDVVIQNGGIRNISARSMKVYFRDTLTDVTNKLDIPPNSDYVIKLAELPAFEGKSNITLSLNNLNKFLEIISIKKVEIPISEAFPSLPAEQSPQTPSVKLYMLNTGVIGGGAINVEPPGYEYDEGTEVQVNATPDANHTFGYWFLDSVTAYGNSQIVKMDRNRSLTAVFLIRSDVDCTRSNPGITIANKTPQSNISMVYLVNTTNRDYKCGSESFELTFSCQSEFSCNLQDRLISMDSGNSSATVDFFMSPKNVTATSKGNYTFQITAKNRGDTRYSSANSSLYEVK